MSLVWLCMQCDLDLIDIALGQGHDTPLCHGQQLCEILSISNINIVSSDSGKDYGYLIDPTVQ